MLKIFNDVLLELDERNVVFLTLLDLSAAFDTDDHNILLNRLRYTYGYSGMVHFILYMCAIILCVNHVHIPCYSLYIDI